MKKWLSVFLLSFPVLALSCAVDELNSPPGGILDNEYSQKSVPMVFLSSLEVEGASDLVPAFRSETEEYEVGVPLGTNVQVHAIPVSDSVVILVNGEEIEADGRSREFPPAPAGQTNVIKVEVTVPGTRSSYTYTIRAVTIVNGASGSTALSSISANPSFSGLTVGYVATGGATLNNNVSSGVNTWTLSLATVAPAARVFVNGDEVTGGSIAFPLNVGVNTYTMQVVAQNYTIVERSFTVTRLQPDIYGILINEWAGIYTKDDCEDYIELKNYGTKTVKITQEFKIYIGATAILLSKYGAHDNPGTYASVPATSGTSGTNGVPIAPNELILVVKDGITSDYIKLFYKLGTPANTKIFRSNQSKLIGVNKKLNENRAYLEQGEEFTWSLTPPLPDPTGEGDDSNHIGLTGSTFSISKLRGGFVYGSDSTEDASVWISGNKTLRTPGRAEPDPNAP